MSSRVRMSLAYASVVTAGLIVLAPLVFMTWLSLQPQHPPSGSILVLPTFSAWREAWSGTGQHSDGLSASFLQSIAIALPATAASVGIGSLTGFGLSRLRGRPRVGVLTLIVAGIFVPPQVILYPMIVLIRTLGLFGESAGLVLVHTIWGLPLTVLIFTNFYTSIPTQIIEAARCDGAGFLALFRHVILPLSTPVGLVAAVLQFTFVWNDMLLGITFGGREVQPVTIALARFGASQFGSIDYNVAMAATLLASIPTITLYALSAKYLTKPLKWSQSR